MDELFENNSEHFTPQLEGILEKSSELLLFVTPDMTITTDVAKNKCEVTLDGVTMDHRTYRQLSEHYDTRTQIDGRRGLDNLFNIDRSPLYLSALTTLQEGELLQSLPEGVAEEDEDYQRLDNDAQEKAIQMLEHTVGDYKTYHFYDQHTQQEIRANVFVLFDEQRIERVREVILDASDNLIQKTLRITKTPVTLDGAYTIEIDQKIDSAEEESFERVPEILATMDWDIDHLQYEMFASAKNGDTHAADIVKVLLSQCESTEDKKLLERVCQRLNQAAEAFASETKIPHNGFNQPSNEDLKEWHALLIRMMN